ncbi:PREDICTED: glucan endo-1,3-beta-glucosidase-like isoform X2 [Camelina sativa]|uniref:glucan endo-1,3-beta-D-glucosidase n=1 Tax=Camelina sativa TaxID=90675 RepID=A0ABM0ZI92_CAMSA|nr:PREDICTED: glucan endo-1,3-beta-glucosidase-like isoform X1 [Camelina sativa]XP_019102369.1 PREDICTED: glucan endo-1,3-beta-glucosidase-like isoform X2 [Camelina sativa]
MAKEPPSRSLTLLLFLLSATVFLSLPAVISAIGVNYGTLGNLPPPTQVANFIKTQTSIDSVKIFDVNPDILRAFAGTGISVVVTVPNGDIPALANGLQARRWVSANILPFHPQTMIKYISVGNEILLSGDNNMINNLLPAMRNLNNALVRAGVRDVKVTTAHSLNIIAYDLTGAPSTGRFRPGWDKGILAPILAYHRRTKSPFMVNPYPYFGFDPKNVNFAIFRTPYKAVRDPFTRKVYTNMFDALMDSTYSAMKALGYGDVNIVVGETGWPSACDAPWCSPANAAWFNLNIIKRAQGQGTPLMPKRRFETYIFGLFNEEGKPGPTAERNWGLFRADFSPVYDVGLLLKKQGGGGRPALPAPSTAGGKWCVARSGATDKQLQDNINWVCGQGGVDCKPIQAGGSCFNPSSVRTHASFVMNAYFQSHGRTDGTCNFSGTGMVVGNNPSNGACKF